MKDRTAFELSVALYLGALTGPLVPVVAESFVSVGGGWPVLLVLGFASTALVGYVAARSYRDLDEVLLAPAVRVMVLVVPLAHGLVLVWTALYDLPPASVLYPGLVGLSGVVLGSGLLTIARLFRDRKIQDGVELDAEWSARFDSATRRWMLVGGVVALVSGAATITTGVVAGSFEDFTQSTSFMAGALMLLVSASLFYMSRRRRRYAASQAGLSVGDSVVPWTEFEGYTIQDNTFVIQAERLTKSDKHFDVADIDVGEVEAAVSNYLPALHPTQDVEGDGDGGETKS